MITLGQHHVSSGRKGLASTKSSPPASPLMPSHSMAMSGWYSGQRTAFQQILSIQQNFLSENGGVSLVLDQTSQYWGYFLGFTTQVYVFLQISQQIKFLQQQVRFLVKKLRKACYSYPLLTPVINQNFRFLQLFYTVVWLHLFRVPLLLGPAFKLRISPLCLTSNILLYARMCFSLM